jgi:imidazolonepropionase-like amidohydrolase
MKTIFRKTTAFVLFFMGITLLFSSCNKCKIDNQSLVFKDANIITMRCDSILFEHSVLIKDRKIIDIGIFEEMDIPKDAQIINGKGKYLIPGLFDMHVHFNDDDDRLLYVANGVTFVRNMLGDPYHLKVRKKINEGCLIGPEIYTTSPLVDGLNPYWPMGSIVIDDKEKVFKLISQMKRDGYDAIKVYEKLSKDVYNEIIKVAGVLDMPVVGHVPKSVGIRNVLASGQVSMEHLEGYKNLLSDEKIISETVESGIWNCPTLILYKKYESLYSLKENPPDELKYVNPGTIKDWKNLYQTNGELVRYKELLHTLMQNNANIVAGTDAGNPYIIAGFGLQEELSIMQDAGLTPYQVLLAATKNCAEMLGYESRLGSIEPKKDADLVLLNYNPLEDINNTKSIYGVMTKGIWYPKDELNTMLEKVADRKNSLLHKLTFQNSVFMKIMVFILVITLLSTILIRPILWIFKKNKIKGLLINDNVHINKYRIRFLVITVSILSLIYFLIISLLPESFVLNGLPDVLGVSKSLRYLTLMPFVILIFLMTLLIVYTIAFLRKDLSTFRKWQAFSVILASILALVLVNYWGFIKWYL